MSSATAYQGGKYLDLFSAQGVDPLSKLRISGGQTVSKEFDPVIKGYVIALSGSPATTRIQLPKAERKHLKLSHFVILFQILIPDGSRTIFEINITDTGSNKRRLQVSTLYGRVSTTPLQAKIPLNCVPHDQWVWFALDVASLISCVYPDHHLQYIDGISCCGTCKVRRIAMLRDQSCLLLGELPTSWFPPPSAPSLPLITFDDSLVEQGSSVTHTSMRKGGVSGNRIDQRHSKPMHIAFGEKIAVPSHVLKSQPHSDKRLKPVPSKSKSTSVPGEPELHNIDQSRVILGKPTRPLPPVDHTPSTTDDSDHYLVSSSPRSFPSPSSSSNVIGTTSSSATITNSSVAGFNGDYYYNRDEGVNNVRMSECEPSSSVSPVRSSSVGFSNKDTGNAHFNFRSVPHSVVGERVVVQHSSKHTAVNNDHHTNSVMVESTDSTSTGAGINSNRGARPDDDFMSNNDTTEEYDWRKYQEDDNDDQTSESSFNDDDNEEAGNSSDHAHQFQQTIPLAGNELLTQSTGFDTLKKKLEELQDFNNDTLDVNEMGGAHSPTATATMATTTDDKVELVYDKDLNCFYDPLTGKYYKLTE